MVTSIMVEGMWDGSNTHTWPVETSNLWPKEKTRRAELELKTCTAESLYCNDFKLINSHLSGVRIKTVSLPPPKVAIQESLNAVKVRQGSELQSAKWKNHLKPAHSRKPRKPPVIYYWFHWWKATGQQPWETHDHPQFDERHSDLRLEWLLITPRSIKLTMSEKSSRLSGPWLVTILT